MRKFVKKQILDIFGTLYEAHDSVRKLIEKKDTDNVVQLLGDCQNTAVQIGDIIDSSEGEGSPVIHLLEDYCEAVYQVSVGLSENITGIKAKKLLDKNLVKAENGVKNDIKIKLEVVFMPYKASMWDSLESVWKAADEDPECDAYVVPIPYYDRNPDHSFGTFHYEGKMYPDYVPVVHYDNYDLEARRPDIIYVHNPYDDQNYVTSVDPRFYSRELKKYTDQLIYIPYFFTGGEFPESLCKNYFYHFFDKVIVQGSKAAEIIEVEPARLLILGSPKADRILNMKHFNIPQDWIDFAKGRKTVLCNTGITAFLNDKDFFNKIEYVFNYFETHNDTVLLWRPHPLLESTIKAMRPEYYVRFKNLVHKFLSKKIGIFDATADCEMAVSFSDAYLGDYSSVIHLFGISGKPIMILNDIIAPSNSNTTPCLSITKLVRSSKPGCFWTMSKYNILCLIDYENGEIAPYLYLHNYSETYRYSGLCEYKNKLYIAPNLSDKLCIIDISSQSTTYIPIPVYTGFSGMKFCDICVYNNSIYLIPFNYPCILKYDIDKEALIKITDLSSYLNGERYFSSFSKIKNDTLILCLSGTNQLVLFNFVTEKTEIITIGPPDISFCMCEPDDDSTIWLCDNRQDKLIHYDLNNKTYTEFNLDLSVISYSFDCFPPNYQGIRYVWSKIVINNNYVFLFPYTADRIIKFNKNTGLVNYIEINNKFISNERLDYCHDWLNCHSFLDLDEENLAFISGYNNSLTYFNTNTGITKNLPGKITEENICNIKNHFGFVSSTEHFPYASIYTDWWGVDDFIQESVINQYKMKAEQLEVYSKILVNADGSCGLKIHEEIKKLSNKGVN